MPYATCHLQPSAHFPGPNPALKPGESGEEGRSITLARRLGPPTPWALEFPGDLGVGLRWVRIRRRTRNHDVYVPPE